MLCDVRLCLYIPYIMHYLPWSKIECYRVPFETQPVRSIQRQQKAPSPFSSHYQLATALLSFFYQPSVAAEVYYYHYSCRRAKERSRQNGCLLNSYFPDRFIVYSLFCTVGLGYLHNPTLRTPVVRERERLFHLQRGKAGDSLPSYSV